MTALTESEVKSHGTQAPALFWPKEDVMFIKGISASGGKSSDLVPKPAMLDIRAREKPDIRGPHGRGKLSVLASALEVLESEKGLHINRPARSRA
jgi:hypothetical protein